jgi:Asp-tRNA(Asn)/Glu-tRNA(Gln) amidotransferase B subunit
VTELLEAVRPRTGDEQAAARSIAAAVERCRALPDRPRASLVRWAMGLVMRDLIGRVDPRELQARLEAELATRGDEVVR